jgi:hypothetical protein
MPYMISDFFVCSLVQPVESSGGCQTFDTTCSLFLQDTEPSYVLHLPVVICLRVPVCLTDVRIAKHDARMISIVLGLTTVTLA